MNLTDSDRFDFLTSLETIVSEIELPASRFVTLEERLQESESASGFTQAGSSEQPASEGGSKL